MDLRAVVPASSFACANSRARAAALSRGRAFLVFDRLECQIADRLWLLAWLNVLTFDMFECPVPIVAIAQVARGFLQLGFTPGELFISDGLLTRKNKRKRRRKDQRIKPQQKMMSRLVASQLFHDFMRFSLVCASLRTFLFFQLVPVWRFGTQQVMDKEILEQSLTKGASRAMPASGNEKQVELFVGLDQGIDDLQR